MDKVHAFVNMDRNSLMPTELFHATSASVLAGLPKSNYNNALEVARLVIEHITKISVPETRIEEMLAQ